MTTNTGPLSDTELQGLEAMVQGPPNPPCSPTCLAHQSHPCERCHQWRGVPFRLMATVWEYVPRLIESLLVARQSLAALSTGANTDADERILCGNIDGNGTQCRVCDDDRQWCAEGSCYPEPDQPCPKLDRRQKATRAQLCKTDRDALEALQWCVVARAQVTFRVEIGVVRVRIRIGGMGPSGYYVERYSLAAAVSAAKEELGRRYPDTWPPHKEDESLDVPMRLAVMQQ